MKKLRLSIIIMFILLISTVCIGCRSKAPQQVNTSTQSESNTKTYGIKRPKSFSPIPISKGSGLGVYGSGKAEPNKNTMTVEIDTKDLSKVKEGYSVKLLNAEKQIALTGKVKNIPDAKNSGNSDICSIEVALEEEKADNFQASSTNTNAKSDTNASSTQQGTSTISSVKVTEDTNMQATIYLPGNDNAYYIKNKCVKNGNDGKKYIWVSKKNQTEIKTGDDFELKEVKLGETDGRKTEILNGLEGYKFIALQLD
ncbi:hypothetical protein Ccar_09965 [Clostridium carboxidivorans P7]|uniref:Uncharacterized protein n=1 Tax=Clostridium carboxidivorans P7 TaxID=536227 RepID=C6PX24_9CLOT|nr:hypothetical protein [Clostridium carboxidivorans]AKN31156.1 hypothetical protein Ccar_09965 [Clostridium carboxidivorans P7]EET86201.1 hypothetical protein CcarbDRAFT_3341 [Clostridium carboxidivorans P7]EFG88264.1 hypothetical protein CLCAR_1838 [Clostridium carboxidivorans P7]